jgi:valyl-tRNA synthetase
VATEISKTYDPASIEGEVYRVWLSEKCFAANPADAGEAYCIVIPPPNVTGALHLGHAINNTLQDILIRNHRMRGFNTLWVPGIDHAGIATQAVVEKQLKEKENKTRHDLGREELVRRIWQWKQEYGDRILEQLRRLGCSCDWDRTRFTLDEGCAAAVRETFFKLFNDGLIYRGKRLVNWDVHLQTSISDDEIYHETVKTHLWHIRYPISGTDKFMVVATTRPETMLGDTAVAVHSQDPRWNWAIGKTVDLPLVGRKIPIIADDILVDPKFGTGVVKVTPAHDPNDYAVWQRHLGAIDILNILNPDGTINSAGGPYAGIKREIARKKIVEDLTLQKLLEKEEPYETEVGHSDRSKTAVEPYLSDQWFVKMAPLAEPALEVVRDGTIKFFPERHAQQYLSWLGEKRDWPISRQLWWGHRIPVWHRRRTLDTGEMAEHLLKLKKWEEQKRVAIRTIEATADSPAQTLICIRSDEDKEIAKDLDKSGYEKDPDVLDTWFSSALWPHSTLGWPRDTPDLKKWYPTNVLVTGRDIITLWIARMVMTGLYNMGKIPFHHVVINPTILDGNGERMAKQKGNGLDPVAVIETHGADALRFTLALMATETQDVRMPVKKDSLGRNTSEKFDIGSRFCNKIWQVAYFFVMPKLASLPAETVDTGQWTLADRWIVSRFGRAVKEADAAIAAYRFDQYANICYDFFYNDYCGWYVEVAKAQLADSKKAPQTANVLAAVLDGSLRLMHPVIPFITETIWWKLNEVRANRGLADRIPAAPGKRLIRSRWPQAGDSTDPVESMFPKIQEIVVALRKLRNDYKVDPRQTIDVSILAPPELSGIIPAMQGTIETLAICRIKHVGANLPELAGAVRILAAGCEIFVQNLADPAAEAQRGNKKCEELGRTIQTLKGRLANESYTARAPAHLVQQTRDQLADAEAQWAKLGCKDG